MLYSKSIPALSIIFLLLLVAGLLGFYDTNNENSLTSPATFPYTIMNSSGLASYEFKQVLPFSDGSYVAVGQVFDFSPTETVLLSITGNLNYTKRSFSENIEGILSVDNESAYVLTRNVGFLYAINKLKKNDLSSLWRLDLRDALSTAIPDGQLATIEAILGEFFSGFLFVSLIIRTNKVDGIGIFRIDTANGNIIANSTYYFPRYTFKDRNEMIASDGLIYLISWDTEYYPNVSERVVGKVDPSTLNFTLSEISFPFIGTYFPNIVFTRTYPIDIARNISLGVTYKNSTFQYMLLQGNKTLLRGTYYDEGIPLPKKSNPLEIAFAKMAPYLIPMAVRGLQIASKYSIENRTSQLLGFYSNGSSLVPFEIPFEESNDGLTVYFVPLAVADVEGKLWVFAQEYKYDPFAGGIALGARQFIIDYNVTIADVGVPYLSYGWWLTIGVGVVLIAMIILRKRQKKVVTLYPVVE